MLTILYFVSTAISTIIFTYDQYIKEGKKYDAKFYVTVVILFIMGIIAFCMEKSSGLWDVLL